MYNWDIKTKNFGDSRIDKKKIENPVIEGLNLALVKNSRGRRPFESW